MKIFKSMGRMVMMALAACSAALAIGCASPGDLTSFQTTVAGAKIAVGGFEAVSAALFAAGEITSAQNDVVQKNGALIITMLNIATGLYPTDPAAAQAELDDAQTQIASNQTKNTKLHAAAIKRGVAKPS